MYAALCRDKSIIFCCAKEHIPLELSCFEYSLFFIDHEWATQGPWATPHVHIEPGQKSVFQPTGLGWQSVFSQSTIADGGSEWTITTSMHLWAFYGIARRKSGVVPPDWKKESDIRMENLISVRPQFTACPYVGIFDRNYPKGDAFVPCTPDAAIVHLKFKMTMGILNIIVNDKCIPLHDDRLDPSGLHARLFV